MVLKAEAQVGALPQRGCLPGGSSRRTSAASWNSSRPAPARSSGTSSAPDRIRGAGGEAAALKSEADGKARGQSDLQTRSLALTQELSQLTAGLAALEAEREATARGLEELEGLRRDLVGDQDQSRALIGDYQGRKTRASPGRSGRRRAASKLAQENQKEQQRQVCRAE